MSQPFYNIVKNLVIDEDMVPYYEIYLLGPQFCGGEKFVVAKVYPEAIQDAISSGGPLGEQPHPLWGLLEWVNED